VSSIFIQSTDDKIQRRNGRGRKRGRRERRMQLGSLSLSLSLSFSLSFLGGFHNRTTGNNAVLTSASGSMSQIKSARDSADFARVHHFTTSPFRLFPSITRFISSPFQPEGDSDCPRFAPASPQRSDRDRMLQFATAKPVKPTARVHRRNCRTPARRSERSRKAYESTTRHDDRSDTTPVSIGPHGRRLAVLHSPSWSVSCPLPRSLRLSFSNDHPPACTLSLIPALRLIISRTVT